MLTLREARESSLREPCADTSDLLDRGLRCLGEVEAPDAAIAGIESPFHQILGLQPIDKPNERDRLHVHEMGQVRLTQAGLARHMDEDETLRARKRQPELLPELLETPAHESCHVSNQKFNIQARRVGRSHHS